MSEFRPLDTALVNYYSDTSGHIPDYLIGRLGNVNTSRRQLMEYYEKHHDKIAAPEVWHVPATEEHDTLPHLGAPRGIPSDKKHAGIFGDDTGNAELPGITAETQTMVTQAHDIQLDAVDTQSDAGCTETSFALAESTMAHSQQVFRIRVPRIPNQGKSEGEPFQCPCCFAIIAVSRRISWT